MTELRKLVIKVSQTELRFDVALTSNLAKPLIPFFGKKIGQNIAQGIGSGLTGGAVEMIGFDNSDKFFKEDTPINQLFTQLEQMPEPMQEQLAPVIQQAIQGFMQNMQMQQQLQQAQQLPVNGGM